MSRRVFYSFHYQADNWRASQVRNIGAIEGNRPASDNDWEAIARGGDEKIKLWIAGQLNGTSCAVVLIGENTAERKWINYEIIKAWDDRKGVVGVHIHNLLDRNQRPSGRGRNPFDYIGYGSTGRKLSSVVKAYDPPHYSSTDVYRYISENLALWIDEAIRIRVKG